MNILSIEHDEERILSDQPHSDRKGNFPRPDGRYEDVKALMDEALQSNAPPSPELIRINTELNRWESYLGIGRVSSFPLVLNAAINDVCNARCLFCPYDPEEATHGRIKIENLKKATWLKFVRSFRPNGALAEPLSHPDITEIIQLVREIAPYTEFSLTTNASLMNPKLVEAIVGYVSTMRISLNASRKESYEVLMAPLKWEQTLENLKKFNEAKIKLGADRPEVIASYVLNKHNLQELPDLPKVLASVGIYTITVVEMYVPQQTNSRKVFSKDDTIEIGSENIQQIYEEFYRECELYNVKLFAPLPYS